MNSILRYLGRPIKHLWRNWKLREWRKNIETNPQKHIDSVFIKAFGHTVNWEKPNDINEVIQWLKLYSDTTNWPLYADKFRVREYVKDRGLEEILVPLYGKYNHVLQINWEKLPDKFIMKVNNGSGDTKICHTKKDINKLEWMSDFSILLHRKIGYEMWEPQYNKMKPCIIVEELLDETKQSIKSSSLIDYKVWCFHGEPYYIFVVLNRTRSYCETDMYDRLWNRRSDMLLYSDHYRRNTAIIPTPVNLEKMLDAAKLLSENIPLVRVDFYEVGKKLYFGEMTMTSAGGYMNYLTNDALIEMRDRFFESKNNCKSNHVQYPHSSYYI